MNRWKFNKKQNKISSISCGLLVDSKFHLELSQLFHKTHVRLAALPGALNFPQTLIEWQLVFLHHVCDQKCTASWNSCCTVYEDVGIFTGLLDEIECWFEGMIYFLLVVVIEVKHDVLELLRVVELQVYSWTDTMNSFTLELLDVVGKLVSTDPYLAQFAFLIENPLARRVKVAEHEHFFSVSWLWFMGNLKDSRLKVIK